jgi:molybdopterin biosynthesis enzyme MoaB
VADDPDAVAGVVAAGASAGQRLIVTTGGTGLGPRDRTPEALRSVLDMEIEGFGEAMRSEGRRSTPMASLSRSLAGALGPTLVIAVPGSPRGALESFEAVAPLLEHALEMLAGRTRTHPIRNDAASARVPGGGEPGGSPNVAAGPDETTASR